MVLLDQLFCDKSFFKFTLGRQSFKFGRKRWQKKRKYVDYNLLKEFFQKYFVAHEQSAVKYSFNIYVCYALDGLFLLNLYINDILMVKVTWAWAHLSYGEQHPCWYQVGATVVAHVVGKTRLRMAAVTCDWKDFSCIHNIEIINDQTYLALTGLRFNIVPDEFIGLHATSASSPRPLSTLSR